MIALALGVAVSAPACAAHVQRPVQITKVYTFPLTLSDASQICVQAPFGPDDPCMSLGQLRRLVRGTGAN